ncbi:MAG TPA: hypothetical protein VGS28_02315 [Candidatus Saccharimonadales bacterium]|nr:hypothetical protein [Candidatus Saccharimonadales bacterium]
MGAPIPSIAEFHPGDVADVAIIGAGPAGVLIGSDLITAGRVAPGNICLVDPTFKAGDLQRKFPNVPGNTAVDTYLGALARYLDSSDRPEFSLDHIPGSETCPISDLTPPIQWLSDRLRRQVTSQRGFVDDVTLQDDGFWRLTAGGETPWTLLSRAVVLTTGGRPKEFDDMDVSDVTRSKLIFLRKALDGEALSREVGSDDSVAILGSSHSGILTLMNLMQIPPELRPHSITMYHRSPLRLSSKVNGTTFYDNTGLKGLPKKWAERNLANKDDGTIEYVGERSPSTSVSFVRLDNVDELAALLEADETCTKIVDARGLVPREKPYVWAHGLARRISTAAIAHFGAIDSREMPGLFAAGVLAPRRVTEKTLGGEVLHAGDVGVTKFAKTSQEIADAALTHLGLARI